MDANAILTCVADAALLSRALGFPVLPWQLNDWPLDYLTAARALAERWIKPMFNNGGS